MFLYLFTDTYEFAYAVSDHKIDENKINSFLQLFMFGSSLKRRHTHEGIEVVTKCMKYVEFDGDVPDKIYYTVLVGKELGITIFISDKKLLDYMHSLGFNEVTNNIPYSQSFYNKDKGRARVTILRTDHLRRVDVNAIEKTDTCYILFDLDLHEVGYTRDKTIASKCTLLSNYRLFTVTYDCEIVSGKNIVIDYCNEIAQLFSKEVNLKLDNELNLNFVAKETILDRT